MMDIQKKMIVTGGAGFIGANLVEALLARGYEVHVVDNFMGGRVAGRLFEGVPVHEVDIRDTARLTELVTGADTIFHLAALPRVQDSIDHPIETHDVNVNGTLSVLEAARQGGVRRVLLASSAATYGDQETVPLHEELDATPKSPYGLHKYIGEQMLALWSELYGLETVSLRFFNVYGPRFDPDGPYALVVGRFLKLHKEGKPLTITGDGTNTRDYVHVHDIVDGLIRAAECVKVGKGEVINLGSGIETSVNDLAGIIGGEVTFVAPRIEPGRSYAHIARAERLLGWRPKRVLVESLQEMRDMHA
jgi:nucleoside-diphosphate-sugar epimerase